MSKAPITRLTGLDVQPNLNPTNGSSTPHGFYIPLLTTAQIALIPATELRNGLIVANSTTNALQVRLNGALRNVNTSLATATGEGLNGSPVILPSGTRAAVELVGNQITGFTYYDTTNNVLRVRNNAAWLTITAA